MQAGRLKHRVTLSQPTGASGYATVESGVEIVVAWPSAYSNSISTRECQVAWHADADIVGRAGHGGLKRAVAVFTDELHEAPAPASAVPPPAGA